jgi:hypothetical protein
VSFHEEMLTLVTALSLQRSRAPRSSVVMVTTKSRCEGLRVDWTAELLAPLKRGIKVITFGSWLCVLPRRDAYPRHSVELAAEQSSAVQRRVAWK